MDKEKNPPQRMATIGEEKKGKPILSHKEKV